MVNYTINLHYNGCFVSNPLQYLEGNHRVVENIDFEGVIYSEFCHIIRKLVLYPPVSYFYVKTGVPLNLGLKPLQTDDDLEEFVKAGYENHFKMDIYSEHNGYNVMAMLRHDNLFVEVDDLQDSDTESHDSLGDVKEIADFQTEDDSNVEIPKISNDDPWLNKLVAKGKFIGHMDDSVPNLNGRFMIEIDDPDQEVIDSRYKAQKEVEYPAFDPETPWNQCKPFLGMRFETPAQLKQCLANYGVAHGYQLWYMQNDIHKLQVLCGRDVSEGRCAGKRGKKDTETGCDTNEGHSKVMKKRNVSTGEPSKIRKATKERWAKKKEEEKKRVSNQEECKFRLWASWMSTERSFQIKTLYPEHNCCRNYNLGALVTYKWIAYHYAREIIDNPWLSYKYMQNSIREKYLIDASLGQCKRAKQCALFDHEGGLVDHADEAFCVNLHTKRCLCRKWEMSGIPCVHAVAAYLHMKMDPELGVSQSYSKTKWIKAYQYGITPVFGSKTWKPTSFPKPLPPLERKMPGRPRKQRIKHPTENDNEISRVGRIMHCHKCWEVGHNKKSCKNPAKPKPANFYEPTPAPEQESNTNEIPEHFVEQMPVYTLDPVLPKQKAPPTRGSTSQSGTKRGGSSVSKRIKKPRLGVSTSKQDYISPEEHAFMMDQEALDEILMAEEAEHAEIQVTTNDSQVRTVIPTQQSQVQGKEPVAGKLRGKPKVKDLLSIMLQTKIKGKDPVINPTTNKNKGKEPMFILAANKNKGKEHVVLPATNKNKGKEPIVQPSTLVDAKKPNGRPKKATSEPSSKPSTKADAKKPKSTTTENVYGRIYSNNRGRSKRIAKQ